MSEIKPKSMDTNPISSAVVDPLSNSDSIHAKRVYIMIGPQGCGKTTWCKRHLANTLGISTKTLDLPNLSALSLKRSFILSIDDYFFIYDSEKNTLNWKFSRPQYSKNFQLNMDEIYSRMNRDATPLYVDNCNMTQAKRNKYVELAKKFDYQVTFVDLTDERCRGTEKQGWDVYASNLAKSGKKGVPLIAISGALDGYEPECNPEYGHVMFVKSHVPFQ